MSRLSPFYRTLEGIGALKTWRRIRPGRLILCYHNVIGRGQSPRGDSSLHLPLEQFEAQIGWLESAYQIVPLEAAATQVRSGRDDSRPYASITFDDAYVGVMKYALPVLRSRGLPSTVFVTTGATDQPSQFWWDLVAELRPSADRLALRNAHGGRASDILSATGLSGSEAPLPEEYLPADWSLLRATVAEDVTFASHTKSHPMLTQQSSAAVANEFDGVLERIAKQVGNVVPFLAYPYGDVNENVAEQALRSGYHAALTTRAGLYRSQPPMRLPRLNVPAGMDFSAFRVEASGLRFRAMPQ